MPSAIHRTAGPVKAAIDSITSVERPVRLADDGWRISPQLNAVDTSLRLFGLTRREVDQIVDRHTRRSNAALAGNGCVGWSSAGRRLRTKPLVGRRPETQKRGRPTITGRLRHRLTTSRSS